ncbi:universal stress protein [Acinetobacter chinensis]|uniref:Universal stress protein n=1 Tax=Acinetobacter chinensis TaxID=2004650 RepID=A0A3B7LXT8_9GAMM|nr:universal stress protein [Acinetobacter chinensis]AXY56457.1 universal stress protein [Acinetobacter chinensis]
MSYNHILVPVDGSQISFSAVRHAAEIAKQFNAQLSLISLVAEDPFTDVDFYYSSAIMKEYFVQAYQNAEKALQEALKIADDAGVSAQSKITKGEVSAEGIVDAAKDLKADLIVIGSHGNKGFKKFLLGSFAQDVLGSTELPVMVIKA